MVILKITVGAVFLSLAMVTHALRCYQTADFTTPGELGSVRFCNPFKWCATGFDDAAEYARGCGHTIFGNVDVLCDQVGDTCQSPPPGQFPWPQGATLCCCKTDLCNGNDASSLPHLGNNASSALTSNGGNNASSLPHSSENASSVTTSGSNASSSLTSSGSSNVSSSLTSNSSSSSNVSSSLAHSSNNVSSLTSSGNNASSLTCTVILAIVALFSLVVLISS